MVRTLKGGLPLWARILAVVVGALVAAQLVTLALTVFFPPAPPSQYSLADIEAALRGRETRHEQSRPLVRTLEAAPPSLDSPGWVVSAPATRDLAKLLGAPERDVRLLFYAPPPLAGAPLTNAPLATQTRREASRSYVMAGMVPPTGARARPGPRNGFPSVFPSGFAGGSSSGVRPLTGGFPPPALRWSSGAARAAGSSASMQRPMTMPNEAMAKARSAGLPAMPGGPFPGAGGGFRASAPQAAFEPPPGSARTIMTAPLRGRIIRSPLDAAVFGVSFSTTVAAASETPPTPQVKVEREAPAAPTAPAHDEPLKATQAAVEPAPPPKIESVAAAPSVAPTAPPATPRDEDVTAGRTLSAPTSTFGFARPSYVEGEFVAALRQPDGRWATVRPQPEGFPNSWQRRLMLWFGLSVALITPLALLVAKRLAAPLKAFAESADRLGREPSADLPPLKGPAEIGVAAEAFNQMQRRVKRYVDDRTGMVRAISHDLRTPLARMRFKLERAPPSLRAAIGRDMDQMEEMIASVLSFMRDEVEGDARQVVDLRSLLEVVVDDATGPVQLEPGPAVLVEIEVVAIQRVMENLIDNAVKYGFEARLRLDTVDGEARVTVSDSGPGIPPEDLETVFKPYQRGAQARASGKSGVGLGLVVSRSTVRAHGGELTLRPGVQGLVVEVRLPGVRAVGAAA